MHETSHGFLHLDHPASPLAGPLGLRGWAAGKQGVPFVDLRLRLNDHTTLPIVHGFPRPDLPGFFGTPDAFLPAGFEATLWLQAGEQELRVEALEISGQWVEIGSLRVNGSGELVPNNPPPAQVMLPHEFARALQFALRRETAEPRDAAIRSLVDVLPRPAVLRYPHAPFHGHLTEPALLDRVLYGRLHVSGWLFHETIPIRRVLASVDLQAGQELSLGGPVPYVAARFPQFSSARHCAIEGWIDVPSQLPGPLCVRTYAELADGSWHLCHVQRTHTQDQEQEKTCLAPCGLGDFGKLTLALRRACLDRGFMLPWSGALWRGIRGVHRESRSRRQPRAGTSSALAQAITAPNRRLEHVTLITHNLAWEGAPLFLAELARHLANNGTRLTVLSPLPGPLETSYRALGADIRIVDIQQLTGAGTSRELRAAIAGLRASLGETDLVIANTLSAYWGVHLAALAQRPSLYYIHESTTPANFYLGHMAPATWPVIEETFSLATHVSFLTESTRAYYRPWLGPDNHSINPGWIDITAIDRYLSEHSRATLRARLGLANDTRLVINVGSVCNRKGQHIFARAVDLFWRRQPSLAAACQFLMIGGRDSLFDHDLARLCQSLGRTNLQIIPATDEPLAYYAAADLCVCSSYEESFPRVIMEAMATKVPILSTAVHGIRDMLTSGHDSWLIPAGDSHAMAAGLHHLLTQPTLARDYADRARQRVVQSLAAAQLLPRHAALAAQVCTRNP